jgi:Kef-type K+ transport system membrane component KefB
MEIFLELSIVIGITVLIAGIMKLLKQPLIIGYIVTGIIVGPRILNIISSKQTMSILSDIGIALLLFIVGLSLNPKIVREVGKVSSITGVGQVIFTSTIGFLICKLLGFTTTTSLYVAVALTFSSTIIIMKLLSDKGDMNTLYGKISIGFLIVQDLIAMFILMMISSVPGGENVGGLILETIIKGAGILVLIILMGIYVLPKITKIIAKSQEFLLLFSIGWCLALASLFYYLNFSMEIGALLAGITLSLSPYRYEISSKMKPLRDFFIVIFFILLGSQMVFSDIRTQIIPIILLSIFILIGNPLIVVTLMGMLGYTKRNGFLAGLTVAQISEFSLILVALGVRVGHLTNEVLSMVTTIGLITIAGSTYMILYSNKIYPRFSRFLSMFEKKGSKVDEHKYHEDGLYDIILFGYNRIGYDLMKAFKKIGKKFLVVDYNPETILKIAKQGFECRYGDASDCELLNELNFSKAKMVYSTIPDIEVNSLLIDKIKQCNKDAIIVVVSHQIDEAIELYKKGATYVVMPHFLGGKYASTQIEKYGLEPDGFLKDRALHMESLKERKKIGHEHPKHERDFPD